MIENSHFPPSTPTFKDVPSVIILVRKVTWPGALYQIIKYGQAPRFNNEDCDTVFIQNFQLEEPHETIIIFIVTIITTTLPNKDRRFPLYINRKLCAIDTLLTPSSEQQNSQVSTNITICVCILEGEGRVLHRNFIHKIVCYVHSIPITSYATAHDVFLSHAKRTTTVHHLVALLVYLAALAHNRFYHSTICFSCAHQEGQETILLKPIQEATIIAKRPALSQNN